jgi:hypothetical protein
LGKNFIEIAYKGYQKKRLFQKLQNSCVNQKGKKCTEKLIFRDLEDNLAKNVFWEKILGTS